jgi:hypothetical protein
MMMYASKECSRKEANSEAKARNFPISLISIPLIAWIPPADVERPDGTKTKSHSRRSRRKEAEYFLMGNLGLVREEEMTGAIEQDELCPRNSTCNQLRVSGRY